MRTIVVANYKGGTGKTTSAVFIAHGLAMQGRRVVFIDADTSRQAGTATLWAEAAGFPFTMLAGVAGRDMHLRVPGQTAVQTAEYLVIDTPPIQEARGVVSSALRLADDVLVPLAPTAADLDDLPGLWAAVEDLEAVRDTRPRVAHLFTSTPVHPRAASPQVYRQQLENAGRYVLLDRVPFGELYAQARGFAVTRLGAYAGVVRELSA